MIIDGLCTCSRTLLADDYSSTSTSRPRTKIQVDQVDDHPRYFCSGSQNDENENGEMVCNSRRSINSLALHWSTTIPSTPFQVSSGNNTAEQEDDSPLNSKLHHLKTGTTIAGCCLGSGHVILGADTRATAGTYVTDKRCEKLHEIASNILRRELLVHRPIWMP